MQSRLTAIALAAPLALSLSAGAALAQAYAPPRIPAAAAIGASASPLVGQGYLPSTIGRDDTVSTGPVHQERQFGGRHRER